MRRKRAIPYRRRQSQAKLLAQGIQRSFIAQRFGISLKTVDEIRKAQS